MLCPADQSMLVMTERKGVEIDYCPTCRGVWLDRGELDKIIDRVETEAGQAPGAALPGAAAAYPAGAGAPPAAPAPAYGYDDRARDDRYRDERYRDDRYRDERGYGHKKKRKESFLEDLFDF
ncbi:zf-TFIIB domain-containing protein [Antribacter sp. KLBMP9083]|uniref:Zf-TFIIB domain-containing protein n=1 Tax=Antribacter soli TaxID=2910976 RepID=A0AA41QGW6_9MICO|nr:zf-TFIIB domain-containing protein [Antribacter soli]MCF4122421.1 zf-TFIIB domain-containing protein [Antribacter soli]